MNDDVINIPRQNSVDNETEFMVPPTILEVCYSNGPLLV